MLISHTYRFVLVKQRNLATTPIENYILDNHFNTALDVFSGNNDRPSVNCLATEESARLKYKQIVNRYNLDDSYSAFGIIRNPWDLVHRMYNRSKNNNKISTDMSFESWINEESNYDGHLNKFKTEDSTITLLKLENISEELENFFSGIEGFNFDRELYDAQYAINFVNTQHYSIFYTNDNMKNKVSEAFSDLISSHSYTFEDIANS